MRKKILSLCIVFVLITSLCLFVYTDDLFSETIEFRLPFVGITTINTGSPCHTGASSEALDFGLAYGQRVYASGNGEVIMASYGWNGGLGNVVKIQHTNSYLSIYAHLSEIVVSVGENVKKGQLIGRVGNSGNVIPKPTSENPQAGKHLHFEIRNTSSQSISISNLVKGISGLTAVGPQNCYQTLKKLDQEKNEVIKKYNENIVQLNKKTKQIDEEFEKAEKKHDKQLAQLDKEWELRNKEWETGWIGKILKEYEARLQSTQNEEEYWAVVKEYEWVWVKDKEHINQLNKKADQIFNEFMKASQKHDKQIAQLEIERKKIYEEYKKKINEINKQIDKVKKECN